jgi:hypothetical protein
VRVEDLSPTSPNDPPLCGATAGSAQCRLAWGGPGGASVQGAMGATVRVVMIGVSLSAVVGLTLRDESYSFDTAFRTNWILEKLREGGMPLDVLEEKLPMAEGGAFLDFDLPMLDHSSSPYTCSPELAEKKLTEGSWEQLASCLAGWGATGF